MYVYKVKFAFSGAYHQYKKLTESWLAGECSIAFVCADIRYVCCVLTRVDIVFSSIARYIGCQNLSRAHPKSSVWNNLSTYICINTFRR